MDYDKKTSHESLAQGQASESSEQQEEAREYGQEEQQAETSNPKTQKEEQQLNYRQIVNEMSEQELAKLFKKAQEADYYLESLRRSQADSENYRRRSEREKVTALRYANQELLRKIVGLLDHLQRALESGKQGIDESFYQGILILEKEFRKVLHDSEVQEIEAVGKPFNPKYHEALSQQESAEYPDKTVLYEMEKGYVYYDRVLRPSKVVVSRKPKETDQETSSPTREDF